MIPKTLKNAQIFIDGRGYIGRTDEINLPKLSRKMDDYDALGTAGTVEIDMGLQKLEMDFTLSEYSPEILTQWGAINNAQVGLRIRAAMERDDGSEEVSTVEINVRGRWREVEFGAIKKGERSTMKVMVAVSYYRYNEDGTDLIEIDIPGMIEKVNGVDRLAAQRAAIGA